MPTRRKTPDADLFRTTTLSPPPVGDPLWLQIAQRTDVDSTRITGQQAYWAPGIKTSATAPRPWLAAAILVERKGRLVITELHVLLDPTKRLPAAGLRSKDLRGISLPSAFGAAFMQETLIRVFGYSLFSREAQLRMKEASRRQGQARDREFYADVAELYLAAMKSCSPKETHRWISEQFKKAGRKDATPSQCRIWVGLARKYGWLSKSGTRGKIGGKPTERLVARRNEKKAAAKKPPRGRRKR